MDPRDLLASQLDGREQGDMMVMEVEQKVEYRDASYVQDGPIPFVCENCKFKAGVYCQKVHGPYEGGSVEGQDSCRFFCPIPASHSARPLDDDAPDYEEEPEEEEED